MTELQRLQDALTELHTSSGESWASFAKRLRLAPKTLREIVNANPGIYAQLTDRAAKGRAKTLFSVVETVNKNSNWQGHEKIQYKDIIKEFGLDESIGKETKVRLEAENVSVEHRTHDDPVLRAIESRALRSKDRRPIRVGIDCWEPFYIASKNQGIESSFAGRLMRRLMGGLSPTQWEPPSLVKIDYKKVIDAGSVWRHDLDAIFSMYETPSRRLEGFEFIRLPGLRGRLGALAIGYENALDWSTIANSARIERHGRARVFVIAGEIGEPFICGSCDYSEGSVTHLDPLVDVEKIAQEIWDQGIFPALNRERKNLRSPVLFCADGSIVQGVEESLRVISKTELGLKASELASFLQQVKVVEDNSGRAPRYPVCIAVHGRASRWKEILESAMHSELLVNGGALTAEQYIALFEEDDRGSIQASPLDEDLPESVAKRFATNLLEILVARKNSQMENKAKQEIREGGVYQYLEKQWNLLALADQKQVSVETNNGSNLR